jgi:hypothetical protein
VQVHLALVFDVSASDQFADLLGKWAHMWVSILWQNKSRACQHWRKSLLLGAKCNFTLHLFLMCQLLTSLQTFSGNGPTCGYPFCGKTKAEHVNIGGNLHCLVLSATSRCTNSIFSVSDSLCPPTCYFIAGKCKLI